jgi:malate dehydrogenase (oxaloacetate-decarboxylating)(NADP+)
MNCVSAKGMMASDARKKVRDPNVLGPMMVKMGDADAFVSGLTYDYPEVIRPALQIHHTAVGAARAAGVYIMIVEDKVFLFTDATVNIDPTAEDLAEIACLAADYAVKLRSTRMWPSSRSRTLAPRLIRSRTRSARRWH